MDRFYRRVDRSLLLLGLVGVQTVRSRRGAAVALVGRSRDLFAAKMRQRRRPHREAPLTRRSLEKMIPVPGMKRAPSAVLLMTVFERRRYSCVLSWQPSPSRQ